MRPSSGGEFLGALFRTEGPGGWRFVRHAPTVDGVAWETSVWRGRSGRTLLAAPKRVRGSKGHGDRITVTIAFAAP